MNILICRISNKYSGAEVYNEYLLQALQTFSDVTITFLTDNILLKKNIEGLKVKSYLVNPGIGEIGTKRQLLFSLINLPRYLYTYFTFFRKVNKANVIIFESMTEKIFLTFVLRMFGKKILWIEHGPLFATQRAWMVKKLYQLNTHAVKKIICVSHSTQTDLASNGIKKEKLITIYIGVDLAKMKPLDKDTIFRLKSKLHLDKKHIIGFVGTLNKEKGIINFIQTARFMLEKNRNINFLVVGDGNLLNIAKKQTELYQIANNFIFTGFVKNIRDYIGIMDVLIFPTSHLEGLSITLLEATSLGIPVVASDIGGNREIISDTQNGLLYKSFSPRNIINLTEKILQNKQSYKAFARKIALDKFSKEECGENFYYLLKGI